MPTWKMLSLFATLAVLQFCGSSALAMAQQLPSERPSYTGGRQTSPSVRYTPSRASGRGKTDDCPQNPHRTQRKTASDMKDVTDAITGGSDYGSIVRNSCRVGNRGFGNRRHPIHGDVRFHAGQDIPASSGTPIYAPLDGTVFEQQRHGGYGRMVKMKLSNGLTLEFAHLSGYGASGRVRKGQIVGYVGMSGTATGPHLHLNVRTQNGTLIDPKRVFKNVEMCGNKK